MENAPTRKKNIENSFDWVDPSSAQYWQLSLRWQDTMKIDDKSGQVVCRNFVQTKLMFPLSSRVGIHVFTSYPDRAGCGGGGGGGDQVWFLSGGSSSQTPGKG